MGRVKPPGILSKYPRTQNLPHNRQDPAAQTEGEGINARQFRREEKPISRERSPGKEAVRRAAGRFPQPYCAKAGPCHCPERASLSGRRIFPLLPCTAHQGGMRSGGKASGSLFFRAQKKGGGDGKCPADETTGEQYSLWKKPCKKSLPGPPGPQGTK